MKWTQTNPTLRPVTWAQLKAHLRLDDDEQRDYVMDLLDTAVAHAEKAMGRSLMPRTVTATFYANACPPDPLYLPRGPVTAVTGVVDAAGNTIPPTAYALEYVANAARLRVNGGLTAPVDLTITYSAGYATAADVPADLRHALKMHVAQLYQYSEPIVTGTIVAQLPNGLEAFYKLHSWETGVG